MALTETITYDTIEQLSATIDFNVKTTEPSTDADGNQVSIELHTPAVIKVMLLGATSNGERQTNYVEKSYSIGTPRQVIYTPQEIYTLLKATTALPAVASVLKQGLLDAINVKVQ